MVSATGLFAMRLHTGEEGAGSDGSIVVGRLRTHDLKCTERAHVRICVLRGPISPQRARIVTFRSRERVSTESREIG